MMRKVMVKPYIFVDISSSYPFVLRGFSTILNHCLFQWFRTDYLKSLQAQMGSCSWCFCFSIFCVFFAFSSAFCNRSSAYISAVAERRAESQTWRAKVGVGFMGSLHRLGGLGTVLPISGIALPFAMHYLMPCDTRSILCCSKK